MDSFIQPVTWKTLIRNRIRTSGSTGRPLTLVQDLGTVVREEAFIYRQLRWAGIDHGDRRVVMRGDIVCRDISSKRYSCRDWWSNSLMLSSYHISPLTAPDYIRRISNFDPVLIQSYPSSILSLASWMISNDIRYRATALRAIFTSSETLQPEMRDRIEEAFGCQVFDWYGQAERVAAIGTCEKGRHHLLTDYAMVELLPDEDGLFEVVGSSYNNHVMPLRRYRTGDLIRINKDRCCCGRLFPLVKEIIGRRDTVVTLPDGRRISRLGHVFKGVDSVIEGQIVYRGDGRFTLRVVAASTWKRSDANRLVRQFEERVAGVQVEVVRMDRIPRGANGKFKFLLIEED